MKRRGWLVLVWATVVAGCFSQNAVVEERHEPAQASSGQSAPEAEPATPAKEPAETAADESPAAAHASLALTDSEFSQQVLASAKPVLVDCWAPWCGPCRAMGPVVEELASDFKGRAVVAKLNVDENPKIPEQYEIDAIPAFLLFKDGQLVKKVVGGRPKSDLAAELNSLLTP